MNIDCKVLVGMRGKCGIPVKEYTPFDSFVRLLNICTSLWLPGLYIKNGFPILFENVFDVV